jgi:LacI family transcriptional regulator
LKYTIKDIAKMAGVSKATVSRVLNNSKPVSSDVRQKVMAVIDQTGYQPSSVARSLTTRRTNLIGVVIPDVSNPVFSKIIEGIESEANKNDYNILLCNSRYNEDKELKYLDILKDKEVDGIILNSYHASAKVAKKLEAIGKPTVLVGTQLDQTPFPVVRIDNEKAAYEAVTYLVESGHAHIGMIHGPKNDPIAGTTRLKGYQQALEDANLKLKVTLLIEGHFKLEDGYQGAQALVQLNPEITAIFCANDEMAIGAIKGLTDIGRKVPEEISVLGFDDIDIARIYSPALTTVSQPFREKGKCAMAAILSLIQGERVSQVLIHPHELIIRESTL